MKKLLLALAVLIALPFLGNSQGINWMTFEEALAQNEKAPKKIIVDVYTDWCGYCKLMDRDTFTNEEIINYINENFYAVKFDAESSKPIVYQGVKYTNSDRIHGLTFKLLGNEFGYPAYVFLDEDNNVLYTRMGYQKADAFMNVLKYVVSQ